MSLIYKPLNFDERDLVAFLNKHANREVPGAGVSRALGRIIPQSFRPKARVIATDAIYAWQQAIARKLARQSPLKLNLGCGSLALEDWINVDLVGLPVDLAWNIKRRLPFKRDSVDAIFHEHVLEHLDIYDGYRLMQDCYRALKPGGVLRIVVPDASRYIQSYWDPEHSFLKSWRGVPFTPMLALQEEFYNFGHCAVYDFETVALFCRTAGFKIVDSAQFGQSRLTPCPDSEWRITDSLYVEAVK